MSTSGTPSSQHQVLPASQLPSLVSRDALRLPLLADAAMAVAVNGGTTTTATVVSAVNNSSSAAGAAPTLTTPTLTPTTLRNIEQMFMDSDSQGGGVDELRPPDPHENSARFEPPTVDVAHEHHQPPQSVPAAAIDPHSLPPFVKLESWVADGSVLPGPHSNDARENTSSESILPPPPRLAALPAAHTIELPTVPLRLLPTEPVPCISTASSTVGGAVINGLSLAAAAPPPPPPLPPSSLPAITIELPTEPVNGVVEEQKSGRRKASTSSPGAAAPEPARGRRQGRSGGSSLTPEEEQKKSLRRQRNKEAAARCRKRRLDQTMSLQAEVDRWEARKAETEDEIRALERQKAELEALLAAHRAECSRAAANVTAAAPAKAGGRRRGGAAAGGRTRVKVELKLSDKASADTVKDDDAESSEKDS